MRRALLITASLLAACFPSFPDESASGVFPCRTDEDCADGFTCESDVCVDAPSATRDAGATTADGGSSDRDGGPGAVHDAGPRDGGAGDPDGGTCEMSLCGVECVDLETNASHCGECDRDCGGGGCLAGECRPFLVADQNATSWRTLVVSETHSALFVTNRRSGGEIIAFSIPGGARTVIASGQNYPTGLAVDDTYAYWSTFEGGSKSSSRGWIRYAEAAGRGTVRDASLDGDQLTPETVGVANQVAYWASDSPLHIRGHAVDVLPRLDFDLLPGVGSSFVDHVLADQTSVYWVDSVSNIYKVPSDLTSVAPARLLDGATFDGISAAVEHGANLFVAEGSSGTNRRIIRVAKETGTFQILETTPDMTRPTDAVTALAPFGTDLAYATSSTGRTMGSIFVMDASGSPLPATKLADAVDGHGIYAVAVYQGFVYWTEGDANISRLRGVRLR